MNHTFGTFTIKKSDSKLPKYQQLINSLLQDIEMGELKPGERLPSINEASEECYLSRDTVERAYTELHKMGVITSIFRKGYFISDSTFKTKTKVLFLVGKITDSTKIIFDEFCQILGKNVSVDIFTYQYKAQQFQEIMAQQLGNYHYYVVIPHLIEEEDENLKCLKKIPTDRLIVLDHSFSNLSQTFASIVSKPISQIKKVFNTQLNLFNKYRSFNLVLTEEDYFDSDIINGCGKFCESISMNFQVLDGLDEEDIRYGEIYFTLADIDLAKAIHYADKNGLKIGKDIGLIGYNDSCFKELLAGGISVISSQPDQMGKLAAEMIRENSKKHVELELQFIQRNSL
jgi:DNA-binding transcriptional regulator YhcF (GntR family)